MYEPIMGTIQYFACGFAPTGYMECDGRELEISSYQAVFALLGTTYGGNAITTFALPDYRGRTMVGAGLPPPLSPITGLDYVAVGESITLGNAAGGGAWSSSDTNIAIISAAGVVTGVAAGTADITYAVISGHSVSFTIIVVNGTYPPQPLISPITGQNAVFFGNTITLYNATGGGFWSIPDSGTFGAATISAAGVVTGTSPGTVTVLYIVSGNSVSFIVTVMIVGVPPAPLAPITGQAGVYIGSAVCLSCASPGGTWSSSNINIAIVDGEGAVQGVAAGTATIFYRTPATSVSFTMTVLSGVPQPPAPPVYPPVGERGGTEKVSLAENNLPVHTHTGHVAFKTNSSTVMGTQDPTNANPAMGLKPGRAVTPPNPPNPPVQINAYASSLLPSPAAPTYLGAPNITVASVGQSLPINILSPYLSLTCAIATVGIFPGRN